MISSVYLDLRTKTWRQRPAHRIEARVGDRWVLLRAGAMAGLMPCIEAETSQIRLSFPGKTGISLGAVRFITPAPPAGGEGRSSW